MRREWIEIIDQTIITRDDEGLPPCGGSGLKYIGAGVTEITQCLPPCGGSGLKCKRFGRVAGSKLVSLHAEGVD